MELLFPISFFNTFSRQLESFAPLVPGQVGIYCCGPTVYLDQHIGNLKTYLFEDVLVRTLRLAGYQVKHVMNITDVGHLVSDADEGEDKMVLAMRREKKRSSEIADYYSAKFFADCRKLNIQRPDVVCKATEHIADMIQLIQRIEKNGFTYISNGNVYFDVSKFPDYGRLARIDIQKQLPGARVEIDAGKKNPFDFVLWFTKSKFENQELQWDSPWGRGYPGWHIECSAMSMKYLGDSFDIHCGGIDHIPVHHTNEIAQSEAATGKKWVHYWLHGEFLLMNADKMAKSKGNLKVLDDLIALGVEPLAYRYLCLSSHYRSQLNFSWEALENAQSALKKLKNAVTALKTQAPLVPSGIPVTPKAQDHLKRFGEALGDDLNTPKALAVVSALLSDKELSVEDRLSLLYKFDEVLGLDMPNWTVEELVIPEEVQALAAEREKARQAKDWPTADRLRQAIEERGFAVKDLPQGPVITKR